MTHFVHYLKRDVTVVDYTNPNDPWFAENQAEDQGFDAPSYHVTRARNGPASRVDKNDTIWLFSQLTSRWGKIPPALDAKIIVGAVIDNRNTLSQGEPAFRFEAGEGSQWFPLFDASHHVAKLVTQDAKGKTRCLLGDPPVHIGRVTRRMRELSSADPLFRLVQDISDASRHLISYRLIDGTRPAFDLCKKLIKDGDAVWWDRWSLPRRLSERREFVNNCRLDQSILQQ
ncbi:MAG: hypothetical protein V7703_14230, partial [Hyphomicrobiales bacterium]